MDLNNIVNFTDRPRSIMENFSIPVGRGCARREITSNRGFSVPGYPMTGTRTHQSAALLADYFPYNNQDVSLSGLRAPKLRQRFERNV